MNFRISLIPFYCLHEYKESTKEPRVLFCHQCGKIIMLPCAHEWEKVDTTYEGGKRDEKGKIKQWQVRNEHLKCTKCGERQSRIT